MHWSNLFLAPPNHTPRRPWRAGRTFLGMRFVQRRCNMTIHVRLSAYMYMNVAMHACMHVIGFICIVSPNTPWRVVVMCEQARWYILEGPAYKLEVQTKPKTPLPRRSNKRHLPWERRTSQALSFVTKEPSQRSLTHNICNNIVVCLSFDDSN